MSEKINKSHVHLVENVEMEVAEMLSTYPDVLTVEQLADALGVGLNTAYSLVRSRRISSVRVGKQIRISKAALLRFLGSEA